MRVLDIEIRIRLQAAIMANLHRAVLGDDLALLSLKVAVQVDRKLDGKVTDPTAFHDFRIELSKTTSHENTAPATISYLQSNPDASQVLARAILETSNQEVSSTNDVVREIGKILEQIDKIESDALSPEDLSNMKRFCLSLHKSMMSQRLPASTDGDYPIEGEIGFIR
jgi:hypothetical protein